MRPTLALGLGEILWDILPESRTLGGAPANFAYHINGLGGYGVPVSCVGDDVLGREALTQLAQQGLNVHAITVDPEHPTGTVNARIDYQGVASYIFPDDVAWDFLAPNHTAMTLASKAQALCFGTLAQRSEVSQKAIQEVILAAPQALKIYDINLRQRFYTSEIISHSLDMTDVLKINDEELALVTRLLSLPSGEQEALHTLMLRHSLKLAVLTRGEKGSLLLSHTSFSDLPGESVPIKDTIGAGDAFTAALALAYLNGQSLDEINRYATMVAAYVCGCSGAMPELPDTFKI
ncbi:carbohydrate kinase [Pseudodesulfovibrio sp. JC047]|uniref:carbohydrate kinase family protein n=1 Tax=Pseudodesulfovibrio sp. JC047 TaxID=2683199 RepID=UPI0013CFA41C|nr:carbohydrate kinase [Pseudodesulfovibrio sp. JC047]NDV18101.1 carbohydrate kinase [Pseudodesulfovibrio sp. JC047]